METGVYKILRDLVAWIKFRFLIAGQICEIPGREQRYFASCNHCENSYMKFGPRYQESGCIQNGIVIWQKKVHMSCVQEGTDPVFVCDYYKGPFFGLQLVENITS